MEDDFFTKRNSNLIEGFGKGEHPLVDMFIDANFMKNKDNYI